VTKNFLPVDVKKLMTLKPPKDSIHHFFCGFLISLILKDTPLHPPTRSWIGREMALQRRYVVVETVDGPVAAHLESTKLGFTLVH
jgi:hypothetical protein